MASLMSLSRSSGGVAGRTADRRGLVLARPGLVLRLRVHEQRTLHARVTEPAELRAWDLVRAGLQDLEPGRDLVSRDQVLLESRLGDEEAVDDVARLEDQPHRL